jgi:hypothetical protein
MDMEAGEGKGEKEREIPFIFLKYVKIIMQHNRKWATVTQ